MVALGLGRSTSLVGRASELETCGDLLEAVRTGESRVLVLSGDPGVGVWRAATTMGIPFHAATPAVEAGLAEFGARVWFRHPLLRSAVYRSAPVTERHDIHVALAEATDAQLDPDRRAWHRAQAATASKRPSFQATAARR